MDQNTQKELFSNVFIQAVAAVAGYACYKPQPDTESVDWGIAAIGGGGSIKSPRLELQLKCTAQDCLAGDALRYPLKTKNYEELSSDNYLVPRILAVVLVPEEIGEWMGQSEEQLVLRRCAYWVSLRGMAATKNTGKVTVTIPRSQQFTVDALVAMMTRIGEGGLP
jgi:hypothetical protein